MSSRVVVDTNVIVSAGVWRDSTPGKALRKVLASGILVVNQTMIDEMLDVFHRPKFDRYSTPELRKNFLGLLLTRAEIVATGTRITACRDPRDNHVLEAAVNGGADLIITGDEDLLALNPFHDVRILTPTDYLK